MQTIIVREKNIKETAVKRSVSENNWKSRVSEIAHLLKPQSFSVLSLSFLEEHVG